MANTPGPLSQLLQIWQGQTFDASFEFDDDAVPPNPVDLTGFTALMMARYDTEDVAPAFTWGTATGEIVLGGAAGTLTFGVPGSVTQALSSTNDPVQLVYDILLTNGATPPYSQRIMSGTIIVLPAVTR